MIYTTETIEVVVIPDGKAIFDEAGTAVRIVDEAGGCFVEVEQSGRSDVGKICIDQEEWPTIRAAINRMIKNCVRLNKNDT